jgi:perosamine synthetase
MNFFNTTITPKAIDLVNEVLKTKFLSAGKTAERFENGLNEKLGLINPVSVNSGTSALHLGLSVSDIGPGDEVILSPQTFIATGLAILMQGAIPIFADIQIENGNIDPNSIRKKITEKTKAIIPVHWAGYPCDLDEINTIAKEFNLVVIEDAAHALGAMYKGRPIGSISRFTAFSFQAIKHLTSADGGALCCLLESDYYQAKRRRWFDIDRENSRPDILGERVYDAEKVGFKYHMNDLAASLALGNLEDFHSTLYRYRYIGNTYRQELKDISGLKLLDYKNDRLTSYWLFTILVERREDFIRALKSQGIPTSVVHSRIDKNTVFGGITEGLNNQEKFNEKQISIPIHSDLTDEDIELIIKTIKEGW